MSRLNHLLIEAMAKHLPPSAAELRLLDVNGEAGATLATLRGDLAMTTVPGDAAQWADVSPESVDSVVAFDYVLNDDFLRSALAALRPGGRLIVVNSRGEVSETIGKRLEDSGYVRLLVETAVECPLPTGVLIRGEKPHSTADTQARIQQVAGHDADMLDLSTYRGRYVHLLVLQTPNKPVWRLSEDDPVRWQAFALVGQDDDPPTLLAFSSLPKAIGFMQPAVVENLLSGVNKVGKFSKQIAGTWALPVLLNPPVDVLRGQATTLIEIDPDTAEAPDE